jgi:membrane-bound serine protease (ClpP class)
MTPAQMFFVLLAAGLVLMAFEVFVPGGILGAIGGLALVGAIAMGFVAFPAYGFLVAIGIVVLLALVIAVWIRIFPRTRFGRTMTVATDLSASKASEPGMERWLGVEGVAVSELRPAGFALLEGTRVDVVTTGEMIERGERVCVVEVKGNRVVVTRAKA